MAVSFEATADVLEITAKGDFTAADVDAGHDQMIELLKTHTKLKVLVNLVDCDKFTRGALLEDLKVNTRFVNKIEKMAIVDQAGHHKLLTNMLALGSELGLDAKIFHDDQLDEARTWLG